MTPQELKNSILQLAIQGRLVEQRPEEGTGEALYQQIQAEKQALIKAGKIKKEKPLPEIAEDEVPFEIPESWKWVRIARIWEVLNGDRGKNYPAKSTLSHSGIPFISALNLNGNTIIQDENLLCLSESQFNKLGNGKLIKGDIVVCIRGSLGKHGRYPFDIGAIASSLVIMRAGIANETLDDYLMMFLDSPLFFSEIREYDNGTAQPNLAAKSLEHFLFPLPPLAEQKRIVAKIEELLPLIDRYEKAWSRLEDFNKCFPGDMQKSILQLAIQGRLVEQRPEEGTGEELYQQIQSEKQALIKAGKIKKEKPLPEIAEDEVPFEIPESWKWVRIGHLFVTSSGTTPQSSNPKYYADGKYNWVRTTDLNNSTLKSCEVKISEIAFNECRLEIIPRQSVCIAMYGGAGTIGKNAIIDFDTTINQSVCAIHPNAFCDMKYLFYYMQYQRPRWMDYASGTRKDPNINKVIIKNAVFPLPPLAEQKRIVAKLEELLPLCERLK